MAGQHIEREARVGLTGMTSQRRDELIMQWTREGWTQRKIAAQLGITQPAVKYAIDRLSGKSRKRSEYDVCDGCFATVRKELLNKNGLCADCEKEL